jgi:acetyl esterase/lipase
MPWDGTELWLAQLDVVGAVISSERIAGGPDESVFQPEWSPDGVLHFVSDRGGWWNLCRWSGGQAEALCPMEAEFGVPQWVFGLSTYAFDDAGQLICSYCQDGAWKLGRLDIQSHHLDPIDLPFTSIGSVRASGGPSPHPLPLRQERDLSRLCFIGGVATEPTAIVELDLTSERTQVLQQATKAQLERGYLSAPEAIEFPTEKGLTAHGFFYAPRNAELEGPLDERPPLIVMSHGGPTSSTSSSLRLNIQFWTSRGFAVLDVDYGGSTGYGRAYRERLDGLWGVVDVDDCVNGARHLVKEGLVDPNRLAITGGSAGGYTTLCALTFHEVFQAGASHYGVSDLEALAQDTHKFESRYLDRLIGPYPAARELYRARSPINFSDRLSRPVIFFQGLEDKIVPPNQAETMVAALRAKGVPVAYLTFEGEQHGFRRSENVKRALEAELYFYGRIFGFEVADGIEPVKISNQAAPEGNGQDH